MIRLVALATVAVVCLCGCASEDRVEERGLFASGEGVEVRALVPEGEAASIGTYFLLVELEAEGAGPAHVQINGERDGSLTGIWVDDVSGDGQMDIVLAMTSAGSGSYGSCHVYVREGERFGLRELAPLTDPQRDGFLGHDTFRVTDGVIFRSFPVYASDDPNARPSGGMLGYRYDFESGSWVAP